MIEFSPLPEAVVTEETELSEDLEDAQASQAAQEIRAPEPVEEHREMLEEADLEIERKAEVALPSRERPKPRPAPQPEPQPRRPEKPAPAPQQQSAASQSAVKAQNQQAQQSTRNAAAQTARGSGRTMSPARWQARLMAHLERHKSRSNGERGTAYVIFSINTAGEISAIRLARSSGTASIDQAALSLIRRASPVPPPPPEIPPTLIIPIKFERR
ncbi:TonB family protein [uncultured Celeribacter sp.]|uniref:energy transducer TonB n=1 Tax=uncultured Celeribacter sp. TaxID=1303376 RepID=UPI002AA68537|nr:TonB family protein [uncultured Celeribacter sp.]